MTSRKKSDIEDLQRIRSELTALNGLHEDAIHQQLDATINALKKFILVKQNKLEKIITKLQDMTSDNIACGLLGSALDVLSKTGDTYSQILKYESQAPDTRLEQMQLMANIVTMLEQLITELQEIEDFLNIDI